LSSSEEILASRAVVPDGVVYREFEAETLLLNLGTGTYHGVNATGARLLALLRESDGDVRAAVERLAAECGIEPDEVAGELAAFCAELAERGLLEVRAK
jgi:PqqD family protein of HPr-rel-A system